MVVFSFDGLFRTTSNGIPDMSNIPASTTLSSSFFVYSLILQSIVLLFFILYFVLSIYRVLKKIKNSKFDEANDDDKSEEAIRPQHEEQQDLEKDEKQPNERLIYRFDDEKEKEKARDRDREQSVNNEKQDKDIREDGKDYKEEEEDYNELHDENEEAFVKLDQKLLFLQPFMVSFLVCNGVFSTDIISIIGLVGMLLSYYLFNIKGMLPSIRIAPILFMAFAAAGFISFFIDDQDLTT